jgi:hypothetical protein
LSAGKDQNMAKAARLLNSVVVEVVTLPKDVHLVDMFHKDAGFVECPDSVTVGMVHSGGAFSPAIAPSPSKEELKATAGRARFHKETAGVIVGGVSVKTDRAAQAQILGALALAQADPSTTFQWKNLDGSWRQLTATQMTAIALAVAQHVQTCYTKESAATAAIDAGTFTTHAQVGDAI